MAGLGDKDRAAITFAYSGQHFGERHTPRIFQMPVEPIVSEILPLIRVVIVHAEYVEIFGVAAKPGFGAAAHVPRLELRLALRSSGGREIGTCRRSDDVNDWIDVNDARSGFDIPEGFTPGNGGAHKLPLQQVIATRAAAGVGKHDAGMDRPCEK